MDQSARIELKKGPHSDFEFKILGERRRGTERSDRRGEGRAEPCRAKEERKSRGRIIDRGPLLLACLDTGPEDAASRSSALLALDQWNPVADAGAPLRIPGVGVQLPTGKQIKREKSWRGLLLFGSGQDQ